MRPWAERKRSASVGKLSRFISLDPATNANACVTGKRMAISGAAAMDHRFIALLPHPPRHARGVLRYLLRPSTLAILVASTLAFSGLYLAERTLARSEQDNVDADAHESAAVLSSFLSVRAEALSAFHALYTDRGVPSDTIQFEQLADALYASGVELSRMWITDSAGHPVLQHLYDVPGIPIPNTLDLDTLPYLSIDVAAGRARRTGRPALTRAGPLMTNDSGFVILDPLVVGGTFRGFAGGTFTVSQLRHPFVARPTSSHRLTLTLFADSALSDTVLVLDQSPTSASKTRVGIASVRLPDGGTWWVAVSYMARSAVRLQLWGAALAALGALVAGLWHERRQMRRIAERSRELEHLSQELLRANRAKSEFLANLSHELRTPLNAVVGFTELLRDGVYGELTPRQSGPVARIEASAAHLREMVDQVLDLARMAAGRLEVHPQRVDLRQFVLDVTAELEPLIAEKGHTISLVMGAGTPQLRTDPAHLRQILVNLLGNAMKFTPEGGVITVSTEVMDARAAAEAWKRGVRAGLRDRRGKSATLGGPDGRSFVPDAAQSPSWVALKVSDTGDGIESADQQRIFEEFEQVNAGSRGGSERRGTGLGLPISRRLANLLGGDLTLESEPGTGSTFTIWLPAR